MDPLTAVITANSAVQLAKMTKSIDSGMSEYSHAIKIASKHLKELHPEMGALFELLESLTEMLESPSSKSLPVFTEATPLSEFQDMFQGLEVRTLVPATKGFNRLNWLLSQHENKRLLDNVQRYKRIFNLAFALNTAYVIYLFRVSNANRKEIKEAVDKARLDKWQRILEWFSSEEFGMRDRQIRAFRQENSGYWFTSSEKFTNLDRRNRGRYPSLYRDLYAAFVHLFLIPNGCRENCSYVTLYARIAQ